MRNFQDSFETHKRSFINAFSICMTVTLNLFKNQYEELLKRNNVQKFTAQKMKFSIKDFFSKCEQIRRKLRICSHLLKKSLVGNFIF